MNKISKISVFLVTIILANNLFSQVTFTPVKTKIAYKQKKLPSSFELLKVDESGLHWQENGSNNVKVTPLEGLKLDYFYIEEIEEYKRAKSLLNNRRYSQAAKLFGDIADTYARRFNLIKNSFPNTARILQISSLIKSGEFDKVPPVCEELSSDSFTDSYSAQLQINRLWKQYGKKNWKRLIKTINSEEIITDFPEQLSEIGYLKGISHYNLYQNTKSNEDLVGALEGFAVAYGLVLDRDNQMSHDAIKKSLEILQNEIDSKNKNDTYITESESLNKYYQLFYLEKNTP